MAEFLSRPAHGRRFSAHRRVRLSDAGRDGVLRLDGMARFLQDVASDDWAESGLDPEDTWVVRRTAVRTAEGGRWPALGEQVALTTWCSGAGAAWAERRTDLELDGALMLQAVALWVSLDRSGRPLRLGQEFRDVYGEAMAGRRVSGRVPVAAQSRVRLQPTEALAHQAGRSRRHRPCQQRGCVGGAHRSGDRPGDLGGAHAPGAGGERSRSDPADRARTMWLLSRRRAQGVGGVLECLVIEGTRVAGGIASDHTCRARRTSVSAWCQLVSQHGATSCDRLADGARPPSFPRKASGGRAPNCRRSADAPLAPIDRPRPSDPSPAGTSSRAW